MARAGLLLVAVLAACGHGSDGPAAQPAARKDGGTVGRDAALEIPAQPLGLARLGDFQWRRGRTQPDFVAARKAENREDWPAVVAKAGAAVGERPYHLEAAWLYAVALAKTGKPEGVLAPLQIAAAGDFGKWALASLEQPALQPWLGTPIGEAWRRRVEADKPIYAAMLARSVVVVSAGDLYAFDPQTSLFERLTRTYGAVVAAYAAPGEILYFTRSKKGVAAGIVDLTTGRSTRPTPLGAALPISAAFSMAAPKGFWIATGGAWRQLDDDGKLHPIAPKAPRPPGPWLELFAHTARLHRLPVKDVSADWDDQSLASAMKLAPSNRVVAAPSPGLIDGNTVVWSPDRTHLAFVAQLDDHCTPGAASVSAAAFVADASTGSTHELARASGGVAVEWISDRELAVVGDHGVELLAVDGSAPRTLDGAGGLVTPRRKPRCVPDTPDEPPPEEPDPEN